MVDDWLLEHLAKVTTLSSILIIIYFLIYVIWRVSHLQMPNNPWNWNDWQWPVGGRHAVEIYRHVHEMPFTLSIDESSAEQVDECVFSLCYLKDRPPPEVTVLWGPDISYVMQLINMQWQELNVELMRWNLEPGQWKINIPEAAGPSSRSACWRNPAKYFIIQRLGLDFEGPLDGSCRGSTRGKESPDVSESYKSIKFRLTPPTEFDWKLVRNEYRYPVAMFVTDSRGMSMEGSYEINGVIQIVHLKSEMFRNSSSVLGQYLKMNTGQSLILQPLYVMDEHRSDPDDEETDGATPNDLTSSSSSQPQPPFSDILCSVCQVSPVTRVIIPCRHVCLCTQCFYKMETCPICRGHISFFFRTRHDLDSGVEESFQPAEPEILTWWQRMERFNERFSDAMGLTRHH